MTDFGLLMTEVELVAQTFHAKIWEVPKQLIRTKNVRQHPCKFHQSEHRSGWGMGYTLKIWSIIWKMLGTSHLTLYSLLLFPLWKHITLYSSFKYCFPFHLFNVALTANFSLLPFKNSNTCHEFLWIQWVPGFRVKVACGKLYVSQISTEFC